MGSELDQPGDVFALFDLGVKLTRESLRRKHPGDTVEELEARVHAWLLERECAPLGDGPGREVPWPRPPR